jgi:hypothetical protein
MILGVNSEFGATAVLGLVGGVGEPGLISPQPSVPAVFNRNNAAPDLPPRGILKVTLTKPSARSQKSFQTDGRSIFAYDSTKLAPHGRVICGVNRVKQKPEALVGASRGTACPSSLYRRPWCAVEWPLEWPAE